MFFVEVFVLFCVFLKQGSGMNLDMPAKDLNQCGVEKSSNLIHHNPWLVDLQYWRDDEVIELRCAATLIDKRHVLTAAHCVKKTHFSRIKVRLGEYDLYTEADCIQGVCADPVVTIDVEKYIVHPDYDGKENDIAILRLAEEAPYTDFIRPVCLPSGKLDADTTFVAAGWGIIPTEGIYSHVKKIIPLPFWPREDCQASYKHSILPQNIICAGGEKGIDTCSGDSGGPLTRVGKKIELWGVTSGGSFPCGVKNLPGVYTRVLTYLKWIEKVTDSFNN